MVLNISGNIGMSHSDYQPPALFRNGHLATVLPALFRKVRLPTPYSRERIKTADDDFLDLDWLKSGAKKLAIISHGLEGSSTRPYVIGMAKAFFGKEFDVLAWNYRGCSEDINKQLRMYHSGATNDLQVVIDHATHQGYAEVHLVGFSLGGNLTLKYLGETGDHSRIRSAVVFSVPLDLLAGAIHLARPENTAYERRFLRSLKKKLMMKHSQFPEAIELTRWSKVKSLIDFDEYFTGPIHGFAGAHDYYEKCSSKNFLSSNRTPTLVVNALNDPFLPPACLDHQLFEGLEHLTFETPQHGGHCGFPAKNKEGLYWSESRALSFCLEHSS